MDWPMAFCIVGTAWAFAGMFLRVSMLKRWNLPNMADNIYELDLRVKALEHKEKP